jgi:hypothetical protein
MPQLFDMPQKEKFNYPGLTDRSLPMPVVPNTPLAVVAEEKPKATRKPKAEKEVAPPTGGKKLKLTKPKHL